MRNVATQQRLWRARRSHFFSGGSARRMRSFAPQQRLWQRAAFWGPRACRIIIFRSNGCGNIPTRARRSLFIWRPLFFFTPHAFEFYLTRLLLSSAAGAGASAGPRCMMYRTRSLLQRHYVSCDSRMMYPGHHRCKSAGLSFFHDLQAMRSRSAQRAAEDDNLDVRLSLGSGSPRSIGWRRRRRDHARFVCKDQPSTP